MTIEAGAPRHYTAADIPTGFPRTADGIINRHGIRLIREFEGPPRLKARLCEGGRFELGPGVTFHLNWASVEEGETCDEEYGEALFAHALSKFSAAVTRALKVEVNSNQFAGMVALAYNIGVEGFSGSTVLKRTNDRRFDDAAESFGMWTLATKGRHGQRLRGLLRRRYAEAFLYLGLDWEEATDDEFIRMKVQKPPDLIGEDKVLFKTPFREALIIAEQYKLPPDDGTLPEPSPRPIAVEAAQRQPDPARSPAAAGAAPVTIETPAAVSPAPGAAVASEVPRASPPTASAAKPPAPQPSPPATVPAVIPKAAPPPLPKDAAPASLEPKDMILSKRFWGLTVTALGTTNLLPQAAQTWVNNEGNRELITWLVVVVIGFALYKYGQRQAKTNLK